ADQEGVAEIYSITPQNSVKINDGSYFMPSGRTSRFQILWATNLLPYEIETLKPPRILGRESRVINWVGTACVGHNESAVEPFRAAAAKHGIDFRPSGGYTNGIPVSEEEQIQRIRESRMAPALLGSRAVGRGYVPCRLFKNISFGQAGVTNSQSGNELFGRRLIFSEDAAELFELAEEALAKMPVKELHDQMDFVARHHTYLNRVQDILVFARMFSHCCSN